MLVTREPSKIGLESTINSRVNQNLATLKLAENARHILTNRCAVCHGCYDAPCQLRLDSFQGLERGAHKLKVYDSSRLFSAEPSRLFYDAQTPTQWREKGFYSMLNEQQSSAEKNIDNSVVAQMLMLKALNPLPNFGQLPEAIDISMERQQQCPTLDEFDQFAKNHPLWGMPYGLPALTSEEHNTLIDWISQGAKYTETDVLLPYEESLVARWEAFLNGSSLKEMLMSRYLFEHLFLNNLYFEHTGTQRFFRLVRSRTAPGAPIDIIATRFPFDDPGVSDFYYRLMPLNSAVLAKTHLPYALDEARMLRLRELFLAPDYPVDQLPGYDPVDAANPFVSFNAIPVNSRYRFLLDDAKSFISGFIKGPVCRGQVAVDVINDHFWVFFVNPATEITDHNGTFLAAESAHLRLPAEEESDGLNVLTWLKYAQLQKDYLVAKQKFLQENLPKSGGISLNLLWDGDGHNDNAALTVFRHFDSATVVKGMVGKPPKTSWIMNYSLIERIHYLLVSGFDVYGNVRHQLYARLYMDFLRMEGEFNFLTALPPDARKAERDLWYRGAHDYVTEYIDWNQGTTNIESHIPYTSHNYKLEFYELVGNYLKSVKNNFHSLNQVEDQGLRQQLERLNDITGSGLSFLPEMSLLTIVDADENNKLFTITRDSAHSNVTHLFSEKTERLIDEDSLTVARGVIGAYPNAFLRLSKSQLEAFVDTVTKLSTEQDFTRLLDSYGVRRTAADFWAHSDFVHEEYRKLSSVEAGLLDYNRLENR